MLKWKIQSLVMAAGAGHWSTMLNGSQIDLATFKQQADEVFRRRQGEVELRQCSKSWSVLCASKRTHGAPSWRQAGTPLIRPSFARPPSPTRREGKAAFCYPCATITWR